MKLEIKHLAPYLPYNLKAKMLDYKKDYVGREYDEIIGIHQWSKNKDWCLLTDGGSKPSLDSIKPILRPLSDLTKEIEHNGQLMSYMGILNFIQIEYSYADTYNIEYLCEFKGNLLDTSIEYWIINKLFEWHFDVFGLIPAGLAIKK